MFNLKKCVLPSQVIVEGTSFEVHTDFQYWINFSQQIKTKNHLLTDFDFLYKNDIPADRQKGLDELINFCFAKKELPRQIGASQNNIIPYDWDIDAPYIFAAFYQQYKIDLFEENLHLHWYKFRALFDALQNTKFNDIVGYRFYTPSAHFDEKKHYQNLRSQWEIHPELTDEEKEKIDNFRKHLKC